MVAKRKQPLSGTGIAVVLVVLAAVAAVAVWVLSRPDDNLDTHPKTPGEEAATASAPTEPEEVGVPREAEPTPRQNEKKAAPVPAGARIVGRVIDNDSGAALRGARATAIPKGDGARGKHRSKKGKELGYFEIGSLPAGAYELNVRAPDYLSAKIPKVTLKNGALLNIGDIELTRGAYVKGTVVHAETGKPIPGAVVRGQTTTGGAVASSPRAVTDDQGRFMLGSFAAGATPLRISRLGYEILRLPEVQLPKGGVATLGTLKLHAREGETPDRLGAASAGLALKHEPGRVTVRHVVPGSPADKASITAGLVVVAIEGYPAEDLSPDEATNLLHGPSRSVLSIDLLLPGSSAAVNYRVSRQ